MSRMRRIVGVVAFIIDAAAIAYAGPAPLPDAKTSPAQAVKTTQFGDWLLTCRNDTSAPTQTAPNCELVQTLILNGQKAPFAQLAIGRVKAGAPLQLTALVPTNISFPSSVGVGVDDKDKLPVDLAWTRCLPMGCFASAALNDDVQRRWGALESRGRVTFKAGNGQDIAMPISFKGLKAGLDALSK